MDADTEHNNVDPQGPTKKELPAPVFMFHRRVSLPHQFHLPFPLFYYPYPPLPFYHMAPDRTDRNKQPPRPRNAFLIYRSDASSKIIRDQEESLTQGQISKIIGDRWHKESEEVKQEYQLRADREKEEHQERYPDYRYQPRKREEKEREKEERKRQRIANASTRTRARRVTASRNANATPLPPLPRLDQPPANTNLPVPRSVASVSQQHPLPSHNTNMVLPSRYTMPFPRAQHNPHGPSPPLSAAPSPVSTPESQPHLRLPSSSNASTLRSPSSESPSSSSLSARSAYLSSLPSSQVPSPNAFATRPLPAPPVRSSMSAAGAYSLVDPLWNGTAHLLEQPFDPHNSVFVNVDVPVYHNSTQFAQFQRWVRGTSSFDPSGEFVANDQNDASHLVSNVSSTHLLSRPEGAVEIGMGNHSTVDYNQESFADFDFTDFDQQLASFMEADSSSAQVVSSAQDDIQSLFQTPNNPEIPAYTAARQRQPSLFTQDMMSYFNFEAAAGETTSAPDPIVTASSSATVASPQVRIQSHEQAAPMHIFTQMTNTPDVVPSASSYVPPAGAIYSSTRRVAASWKPPLATPPQMDDSTQSWAFFPN